MRALIALALALSAVGGRSAPLGLDLYRPVPADNPLTPPKVALGTPAFSGPRSLARRNIVVRGLPRSITCVCQQPCGPLGPRPERRVGRNVPTLINRAYGESFFWDGRAESLEQQVVQPLLNPSEMAMTPEGVIATVRRDRGYTRQFLAAFGREARLDDVARALASYVRTIRSGNSRYDRFRSGDTAALTRERLRPVPKRRQSRAHRTGTAWDARLLRTGGVDRATPART